MELTIFLSIFDLDRFLCLQLKMNHFAELESILESERRAVEASRKQLNIDRAAVAEQKRVLEGLIMKARQNINSQQNAIQHAQMVNQQQQQQGGNMMGQQQFVDMKSAPFIPPGQPGSTLSAQDLTRMNSNMANMGASDQGPVVREARGEHHPSGGNFGRIG